MKGKKKKQKADTEDKVEASERGEEEVEAPDASDGTAEETGGNGDAEQKIAADTDEGSEDPAEVLADQLARAQDRLMRLQADFDNFRKRTIRERQDINRRATEGVLLEMLPVLDHFELALQAAHAHEADEQLVQGFRLVAEQISASLKTFGLEPIEAEGAEFDHNLHEAISHIPSADHDEGIVVSQTKRGYTVGDRLLRPAQVVVSSGPPQADERIMPVEQSAEE